MTILRASLLLLLVITPPARAAAGADLAGQRDPLEPSAADFLDAPLDSLEAIAVAAYQSGDWAEAARGYLAALDHDITNARAIYNLACCYGLMGEPELAARNLARAFRAGFTDLDHAREDPDFGLVRSTEPFGAVIDSLAEVAVEAAPGSVIAVRTSSYLPCTVVLPPGYDSTRSWPLVVGLHGRGSTPERFAGLWQHAGLAPGFIYACPRAPYLLPAGRENGWEWRTGFPGDSTATAATWSTSADYVIDAVLDLRERYPVSGVWLLGFSQGCGLAYVTGIRFHDTFRGLVCLGGWLDDRLTEDELRAAAGLPVFIGHGAEDPVVEYANATSARDRLEALGFEVTFHPFAGGHSVPHPLAAAVLVWLEDQ